MNLIVLLKETFDTEEKIRIENGRIVEEGAEWIINPYDEYAVEEAIRLKEAHGGEVTVMTVGPERAENTLRKALAMGADKAIHIHDPSLFGDEYVVSQVLASAIQGMEYDLILAGNLSVDNGAGQVAVRVAELLGINHIATVTRLEVNGRTVTAERDVEGDVEIVESVLPVLITAQQGLNDPRYPSLPGIMKAKKKPLTRLGTEDIQADRVSKTEIVDQYLPPAKQSGKILQGELKEQAAELVRLLRTEAKVI